MGQQRPGQGVHLPGGSRAVLKADQHLRAPIQFLNRGIQRPVHGRIQRRRWQREVSGNIDEEGHYQRRQQSQRDQQAGWLKAAAGAGAPRRLRDTHGLTGAGRGQRAAFRVPLDRRLAQAQQAGERLHLRRLALIQPRLQHHLAANCAAKDRRRGQAVHHPGQHRRLRRGRRGRRSLRRFCRARPQGAQALA